jgi:hypothetical protein
VTSQDSPPNGPRGPPVDTNRREPAVVSTEPGDGALHRDEANKDAITRQWDPVTPSATMIGRAEDPESDVGERIRRLHDEHHPAMEGHGERMHRLDKARITQALSNSLDLSAWERDRALGVILQLDLTAFGSQRAIPKVALVVIKHVVDEHRKRRLGLHDADWIRDLPPDLMTELYDRFTSITDEDRYREAIAEHGLDVTAVNRLDRILADQLESQDLVGAVLGRSPNRDPHLPDATVDT